MLQRTIKLKQTHVAENTSGDQVIWFIKTALAYIIKPTMQLQLSELYLGDPLQIHSL